MKRRFQDFNFLRWGMLLVLLVISSFTVVLTSCKYISWYSASNAFYIVRSYGLEASVSADGTPNLPALTSVKGWWAYVMQGGGGTGRAAGGKGGYCMGAVYLNAGETLYGAAGHGGYSNEPTKGTRSASAGYGGGMSSRNNEDGKRGSGGGATILSKQANGFQTCLNNNTTNINTTLIAVAGGGGGTPNGAGSSSGGAGGALGNAVGCQNGSQGGGGMFSGGGGGSSTAGGGNSGSGDNIAAGFLKGGDGAISGNNDHAGGGSGYYGGGCGDDPTIGNKSAAGGGSTYNGGQGSYVLNTSSFAYTVLNTYNVASASDANGIIYLVYMGDNNSTTSQLVTYTY